MKVFVTGHKGYIGAHVVSILKTAGHDVTGCDIGLFDGCEFFKSEKPQQEISKDIRLIREGDLKGHDAVIHLAALSNDPMGDIDPALTLSINYEASVNLAQLAKKAGIPKFLFSSSCSIYGKGSTEYLSETDATSPLTPYAISKIKAEADISRLASEGFSPVFLRNATAFGYSPALRIDLVVNNLLACAFTKNKIEIKSDGTPWRPFIHCIDIARAFKALLEAPAEVSHNQVINIGSNDENYQVSEVANLVHGLIPSAEITYTGEHLNDPRNYKVNFDKLRTVIPAFGIRHPLKQGLQDLLEQYKDSNFRRADFESDRYIRLKILQKRMHLLTT